MTIENELLAIEKQLWTGASDAYLENLDEQCLVAFIGMAGAFGREEIAGTVEGADRWRDVELDVEDVLQATDDVAIFTYTASAVRGEGERYRALVSSGYVRRDGSWKLMFHQQAPLPADDV